MKLSFKYFVISEVLGKTYNYIESFPSTDCYIFN